MLQTIGAAKRRWLRNGTAGSAGTGPEQTLSTSLFAKGGRGVLLTNNPTTGTERTDQDQNQDQEMLMSKRKRKRKKENETLDDWMKNPPRCGKCHQLSRPHWRRFVNDTFHFVFWCCDHQCCKGPLPGEWAEAFGLPSKATMQMRRVLEVTWDKELS